jgi:hypothetical protein
MSTVDDCLGRFVWHDLMTTDVDAAKAFYTALFPEWALSTLPMEGGFHYDMIGAGGSDFGGIVSLDGIVGVPSHWIGYVAVEDCDATVAKVEQLGGRCVMPAVEMPNIGKFAVVHDAQGAHFKPFQLAFPRSLPKEPAIGQFCWDELRTSDIAAARSVYCDLFGWESSEVDMGEMGVYVLFKINGMEFAGGMLMPPDTTAPPNWLPYLCTDDIDARAAKAVELGATIFVKPTDIPNAGRFSVHADPTGAAFALIQSTEL